MRLFCPCYSLSLSLQRIPIARMPSENRGRILEAEGPQSDPLREELRLAQIELHQHPVWRPEYAKGFKRVANLQAHHAAATGVFHDLGRRDAGRLLPRDIG